MIRQNILALTVLTLSILTIGCQKPSPALAPAPVEYGEVPGTTEATKIDINPKVDILFVIDDSGSMRAHQANLAANIDRFVEGFAKNSLIDFHIGVLTIWDSRRYGTYNDKDNTVQLTGVVPQFDRNQVQQFDNLGFLKTLKAPKGREDLLKNFAPNFISKGDGYIDVLRETLKVGVHEYHEKATDKVDANGPKFEEVFTPIKAALRAPVENTWNKNFSRNDSHLVVVFLTDGNDASTITADNMVRFFTEIKGEGNFSVFGVINPSQQPIAGCDRDNSGRPVDIENLIQRTNGRVLNICSNYGSELVGIGKMIQDRTIKTIRYQVAPSVRLSPSTVKVTYGDSEIPYDQKNGWVYDGKLHQILIRGAAQWTGKADAKISIVFEPVDPSRQTSHCVGCNHK